MTLPAWHAALRVARRDAMHNKGRTALVLALIGLPVMVLAAAAVARSTYTLDRSERLARTIGTADVGLQWSGLATVQQDDAGYLDYYGTVGDRPRPVPAVAAVAAALPTGSRVIEADTAWSVTASINFATRAGLDYAPVAGLDLRDPLTRGIASIASGRAPRTVHEVALTTALASSAGLRVGDVLQGVDPARRLRIVGLVRDENDRATQTIYALPALLPHPTGSDVISAGFGWLAATPRPITWADVRHLNALGFAVLSRQVYLHPSAAAKANRLPADSSNTVELAGALVTGMAALEVVLLAGPAFAISAKRRRRSLGLAGAVGAAPRDLRRMVLADGVVLGVGAGIVGVLGGILAARFGQPALEHFVTRLPGRFSVPVLPLVGLFGAAVLSAMAAAYFPARAAARADVVSCLADRPSPQRPRRWFPILGLVVAGLGVVVALAAPSGSDSSVVILAGTALVEVGLIMCTPVILSAAARLGRWLPLAPRLALRDTSRNRSAATPAVAAVMAAMIGAVAITVGLASQEDRDRRQSPPAFAVGTATVDVSDGTSRATADRVVTALRQTLPVSAGAVISAPSTILGLDGASAHLSSMYPVVVIDAAAIPALFGDRPDLVTAITQGTALVADPTVVHDGRISIGLPNGSTNRTVQLPARVMPSGNLLAALILPASTAQALDLRTAPAIVVARETRMPTGAETQAAYARLRAVIPDASLQVQAAYHDRYAALAFALQLAGVVIAVLAAVIATALANVDGRRDLTTLGAVGAAPRTRRVLAAARAATIAVLGSGIGAAAGFVVPAAFVLNSNRGNPTPRIQLVVPWLEVVAVVVATPVVAVLVTAVATRSRIPAERAASV